MSSPGITLYAEDDANDAFFMQIAFEELKRESSLRIVPNGKKAIEYLAGEGVYANREKFPLPAILILDIKMPILTGLEVLAWVRARPEFARLPVVMFTSSNQDRDLDYSRTHGANAYLIKPSNADDLASLIRQLDTALAGPAAPTRIEMEGNRLVQA